MIMVVVYHPERPHLFNFGEVPQKWWIRFPSKLVVESGDELHDVDTVHGHNWLVCHFDQLIEIKIKE